MFCFLHSATRLNHAANAPPPVHSPSSWHAESQRFLLHVQQFQPPLGGWPSGLIRALRAPSHSMAKRKQLDNPTRPRCASSFTSQPTLLRPSRRPGRLRPVLSVTSRRRRRRRRLLPLPLPPPRRTLDCAIFLARPSRLLVGKSHQKIVGDSNRSRQHGFSIQVISDPRPPLVSKHRFRSHRHYVSWVEREQPTLKWNR